MQFENKDQRGPETRTGKRRNTIEIMELCQVSLQLQEGSKYAGEFVILLGHWRQPWRGEGEVWPQQLNKQHPITPRSYEIFFSRSAGLLQHSGSVRDDVVLYVAMRMSLLYTVGIFSYADNRLPLLVDVSLSLRFIKVTTHSFELFFIAELYGLPESTYHREQSRLVENKEWSERVRCEFCRQISPTELWKESYVFLKTNNGFMKFLAPTTVVIPIRYLYSLQQTDANRWATYRLTFDQPYKLY